MAVTAELIEPCPVTTMTSASGSSSLVFARISRPSTSSIFMSVTTTSKFSLSMSATPRFPELATVQSQPMRSRLWATAWAWASSSSTIRTRMGMPDRSPGSSVLVLGFMTEAGGNEIKNRVPRPGSLSQEMLPWCASTILRTVASPRPLPVVLVEKNVWNNLDRVASSMPAPLSMIANWTRPSPNAGLQLQAGPRRASPAGRCARGSTTFAATASGRPGPAANPRPGAG